MRIVSIDVGTSYIKAASKVFNEHDKALEEAFSKCDIVTRHTPLTEVARRMDYAVVEAIENCLQGEPIDGVLVYPERRREIKP
ncbi:MAG: hypothetical protein QW764_03250 [Desulfurococcaceae archaeon]